MYAKNDPVVEGTGEALMGAIDDALGDAIGPLGFHPYSKGFRPFEKADLGSFF